MLEVFILLIVLQIKHWYIDFVNQSQEEIKGKAVYGNWLGINHSVKHGVGTMISIFAVLGLQFIWIACLLALLDTILHYHIDLIKMKFGSSDITGRQFWNHLGLDQLAHQLCYIGYAWYILL